MSGLPHNKRGFFTGGLRRGRLWLMGVVLAAFLTGYTAASSYLQSCDAQFAPIVGVPTMGTLCGCGFLPSSPCTPIGGAFVLTSSLSAGLLAELITSVTAIENYIGLVAVDTMVDDILTRLNKIELDIIAWWETMWYYNERPAMQQMTEQLDVSDTTQSKDFQTQMDVEQQQRNAAQLENAEIATAIDVKPSEQLCTAATNVGGLGRAQTFGRALRKAWEQKSNTRLANKSDSPVAKGVAAAIKEQTDEYENLFCDPDDNNGQNTCGASNPAYYNADTQVTGRLYNVLTLSINKDTKDEAALERIYSNLTGTNIPPQNMAEDVVSTAPGMEMWAQRRSYLARKNAMRALPQFMASLRTPGGQTGQWTKGLRDGAGITLDDISDNPSYKEIMHAVTVDRFNSGHYATDMLGDDSKQELEKLTLNAFYLMQLRDYYELLERTALVLAVQVSSMAEGYQLPDTTGATPKR